MQVPEPIACAVSAIVSANSPKSKVDQGGSRSQSPDRLTRRVVAIAAAAA